MLEGVAREHMRGRAAARRGEYAHVALDRREERLQPFIRGRVSEVASEDLGRG